MPFVLGLHGSPRRGANSDSLLARAMEGAASQGRETRVVHVADLTIDACHNCGGCRQTGQCVLQDDMQQVYPLLEQAAAIVVASPIFFMGLPAQLKAVIDRCQPFWARRYLLHSPLSAAVGRRPGLFLATAALNLPHVFEGARWTVQSFFHVLDVDYAGELLVPGIEKQGGVADRPGILEQAFALGQRLFDR